MPSRKRKHSTIFRMDAHIFSLPNELLLNIIEICAQDGSHWQLVRIAGISKRFKKLIFSLPRIWSCIRINNANCLEWYSQRFLNLFEFIPTTYLTNINLANCNLATNLTIAKVLSTCSALKQLRIYKAKRVYLPGLVALLLELHQPIAASLNIFEFEDCGENSTEFESEIAFLRFWQCNNPTLISSLCVLSSILPAGIQMKPQICPKCAEMACNYVNSSIDCEICLGEINVACDICMQVDKDLFIKCPRECDCNLHQCNRIVHTSCVELDGFPPDWFPTTK